MSSYGYVITTSKFTAVNEAMADQLRPTLYPDAALPSRADFPFEQRNRSPSFVPNPISAPERTYSSTTTTKKRSARDRCKDDADLRQSRRRRLSKEPLPDASLACPFAKHNPITSPGCWNFAAENLARLKEHLLRRHERRPYCPICLGQFDSDTLRDIHVRERTCHKVNGEQIGAWMDPKAAQRIRQRTKKSENAKEGWQRMYSVIFPDDETIHSPYVEDIGQLYVQRIRKTVANDFVQHIHSTLDFLSTNEITNEIMNEPPSIKAAFMSCLRHVADQYIAGSSSISTESTITTAHTLSDQSFCHTAGLPTEVYPLPFLSSGSSSPERYECSTDVDATLGRHSYSCPPLSFDHNTSELQSPYRSYVTIPWTPPSCDPGLVLPMAHGLEDPEVISTNVDVALDAFPDADRRMYVDTSTGAITNVFVGLYTEPAASLQH